MLAFRGLSLRSMHSHLTQHAPKYRFFTLFLALILFVGVLTLMSPWNWASLAARRRGQLRDPSRAGVRRAEQPQHPRLTPASQAAADSAAATLATTTRACLRRLTATTSVATCSR